MYWSQQDLQVYSFDTVRGDLVVWDRHNPDVTPTFLQHYCLLVVILLVLLLGKKPPWPPCPLSSTQFLFSGCINLLLPVPLTCTLFFGVLFPFSLHAKTMQNYFFLLQAYFFFSLIRLSRKPFFNPFFYSLQKKREKMWEKEKRKMWERWTEHGSDWWWWGNVLTDVVSQSQAEKVLLFSQDTNLTALLQEARELEARVIILSARWDHTILLTHYRHCQYC